MRLDTKYFPAFMAVVAVLTALAIVFSSLRYKETQKERFIEAIQESDSLLSKPLLVINESDSVSINEYTGNDIAVIFGQVGLKNPICYFRKSIHFRIKRIRW